MFKYARKCITYGFKLPSLCECAHIFNNDNNNNETKQLQQSHTHFRVMMMGIIFSPPCQESGSFAGVYVNCMLRLYFKCFVNFIMTQTFKCKMHDIETDTSPRTVQVKTKIK